MTDMSLPKPPENLPRWSECPLEPRVRSLEGQMAVVKRDVVDLESDFSTLPESVAKLREAVSGLKTQTKITWALMLSLLVAIIGGTVSLIYTVAGGIP